MPPPVGPPQPLAIADNPRLLELIGDTMGLLEIDEFRDGLLRAVRQAVRADWIALNDIGEDPETMVVIIDPPAPVVLMEHFREHADENPLVQRYRRTRDGSAVRFSDVATSKQIHALPLYELVYRPLGIEHMIAFTLPHQADRILGIALGRHDPDFTDEERDLLDAARPFLIQAYRNALHYTALLAVQRFPGPALPAPGVEQLVRLGLTDRQAQVLQLLATGVTERDIATHLGVSRRTVEKHIERCYRALAVNARAQAVALAWGTVDAEPELRRVMRPHA